jgi:predicted PurR-regulated permease PerM
MSGDRRRPLAAVLVGALVLAAAVLSKVLGTVFFTVTVAYLLAPLHRRFVARGLPPRLAAGASALAAALALGVPLSGAGYLVYARREVVLGVLRSIPAEITVGVAGTSYTADLIAVRAELIALASGLALDAAAALPVLALKATVFGLLLFALLMHSGAAASAALAPVPARYHDVMRAFHVRTRETLYAIYVLQAATALGTFLVALPTFWVLGYQYAVTLALASAALQFVPIVGPSVVVAALAASDLLAGDPLGAVSVAVVGLLMVAWLPDAVIRPRLARETAGFPGSLYFVGFVGGLLTVGPVGVIAGPLAVALVVEAAGLLAAEDGGPQSFGETGKL